MNIIADKAPELLYKTLEHLMLTGVSTGVAVLIGLPLGVWIARRSGPGSFVLGAAGIVQTIPSLAMLAFLLPFMGIGVKPALVALTLYAILPILRNTSTGLNEIPPEIIEAVQGAVAWFGEARLTGIRQVRKKAPSTPKGRDTVVVKDPSSPPMWARFYGIGTNKPIFCSRDGVPRETLAEISYERRNGYSWLGYYAAGLLAKDYPAWQKKWAPRRNVLRDKGK